MPSINLVTTLLGHANLPVFLVRSEPLIHSLISGHQLKLEFLDWQTLHETLTVNVIYTSNENEIWLAHYLIGLSAEKNEQKMAAYSHAFNTLPNQPEPLYRMAAINRRQQDFVTALGLSELASTIEPTSDSVYREGATELNHLKSEYLFALHGTSNYLNFLDVYDSYSLSELTPDLQSQLSHCRELILQQLDFVSENQHWRTRFKQPFDFFDAIYCINLDSEFERWQTISNRFKKLGVAERVIRFSAIATPNSHHIGCALSHREIVAKAQEANYENVLIIEDDAVFIEHSLDYLRLNLTELEQQEWNLLYLGGHKWEQKFCKAENSNHIEECHRVTCTHAIAYHQRFYSTLLEEIPMQVEAVEQWCNKEVAIDQYLARCEKAYITSPVIATQPPLLPQEAEEDRFRFII